MGSLAQEELLYGAANAIVEVEPRARQSGRSVHLRSLEDPFIDNWGTIADAFGMPRGTGRVHALVYLSLDPLCAPRMAERLEMRVDHVEGHLRQLCSWGVVHATHRIVDGEGHLVYDAERDPWTWFLQTLRERRHREFVPLLMSVRNVSDYASELLQAADPVERERLAQLHLRIARFSAFFEELAHLIDSMARLGKGPLFKALKMASRFVR